MPVSVALKFRIRQEIEFAREMGLDWTPFRPFHEDAEITGAEKCSRCRIRPSTRVSYAVNQKGFRRTACTLLCKGGMTTRVLKPGEILPPL